MHQHQYQITATEKWLARSCTCGKTWIAYVLGISSYSTWEEVREPVRDAHRAAEKAEVEQMTEYPWHIEVEMNGQRIVVVAPTADINTVFRRIGEMAMSVGIERIIVYRDRQEYRHYLFYHEEPIK